MNERFSTLLAASLVALATALVYGSALGNGFVTFDDNLYVTENPIVRDGWTAAGFRWAFTAFHSANWHPLTWLSHMTDVELFGLDPGGHHATSVVLHALNGVLLFFLLRPFVGRGAALVVALLFVVHPLRVESVAWVSERKDVLAATFFLLTLHAWAAHARHPRARTFVLALVAFALGLMAKPMLVTLPCVLLLFDLWPLERQRLVGWGRLLLEKLPFFALSVASSIVTMMAQERTVRDLETLSLQDRLLATPLAYGEYLRATVWPEGLACLYPHGSFAGGGSEWISHVWAGALVLSTLAALFLLKRAPWFTVGWLWFLGMLVPVIGLVQVGSQAWADRYAYLPTIGLYVIVVEGLRRLPRFPTRVRTAGAAVTILALGWVAHGQTKHWLNGESLWRRAVDVTEGNFVAHNGLALILARKQALDEAEEHFRIAAQLNPNYFEVRVHLAGLLSATGREEAAIEEYRKMLWARPMHIPSLTQLGSLLARMGQLSQARRELEKALQRKPGLPEARFSLGLVSLREGKEAEALQHFRVGSAGAAPPLEVAERYAWTLSTSSRAELRNGQEALRIARHAVSLSERPSTLRVLAAAQAEAGDFSAARATQSRVTAAFPESGQDAELLASYTRGEAWRE